MDEHQDETTYGNGSDAADETPSGRTGRGGSADQMVNQLQSMIDSIARQAGPVVREVAAKAAELAAVAGEKAGPVAHRAADITEEVGVKVAARGKEVAADLRRSVESHRGQGSAETVVGDPSDGTVVDVSSEPAPGEETPGSAGPA